MLVWVLTEQDINTSLDQQGIYWEKCFWGVKGKRDNGRENLQALLQVWHQWKEVKEGGGLKEVRLQHGSKNGLTGWWGFPKPATPLAKSHPLQVGPVPAQALLKVSRSVLSQEQRGELYPHLDTVVAWDGQHWATYCSIHALEKHISVVAEITPILFCSNGLSYCLHSSPRSTGCKP